MIERPAKNAVQLDNVVS